jgi:hypothetical protein
MAGVSNAAHSPTIEAKIKFFTALSLAAVPRILTDTLSVDCRKDPKLDAFFGVPRARQRRVRTKPCLVLPFGLLNVRQAIWRCSHTFQFPPVSFSIC